MFPIRDHNPSNRTPFVTYMLIAVNVAVYLSMLPAYASPRDIYQIYDTWALVPAEQDPLTFLTSAFLHGSFMHIAFNMLFLWIFGDNLEDEMGHLPFLLFYLACGIGAGVVHAISAPGSPVPMVGASGAIAGVMGGYLLLFPKAKVDVLFIFIVFYRIFAIPAWIMLGVWFGLQFLNGLGANPLEGGVAYWAHAGGFLVGIVLTVPVWLRKGGPAFWNRTHGHPPHPDVQYARTSVPVVRRR